MLPGLSMIRRIPSLARAARAPAMVPRAVVMASRMSSGALWKAAEVRGYATMKEKNDARRVFDLIDKDSNNSIDVKEFQEFVKLPDLYNNKNEANRASDAAAKLAATQIDTNTDGRISFDEFLDWWQGNVTVSGIPASIQENMKKL
eukprot:CAMPEP_0197525076 /NCGR_PEP_ID=MMETSP1318-20131121/10603_1 /TAXON_ID=552666 /ORGANISM="Partenskyella glossopodia, Strain RCC365" /LENGTH=145 /DNA_ID=CAMNT_0043078237 /DNA_START=49 /DNA_END=486 /DNA_ORIENTATION=+